MRFAFALVAALAFAGPVVAQDTAPTTGNPKLLIFADTAGVARVQDDVYVTWIFARATPTSLPSSGVLVAFDCRGQLVKRLAHVVYQLKPDSSGVAGSIVEDEGGWVPPTIPHLFKMICEVGGRREGSVTEEPTIPKENPKPEWMYPVS